MTQMHMECVYSPAKKGKKAPGYSLRCLYPAGTRSTLWDIRSDEPLQLVGAGRGDPVNLVERTDVRWVAVSSPVQAALCPLGCFRVAVALKGTGTSPTLGTGPCAGMRRWDWFPRRLVSPEKGELVRWANSALSTRPGPTTCSR